MLQIIADLNENLWKELEIHLKIIPKFSNYALLIIDNEFVLRAVILWQRPCSNDKRSGDSDLELLVMTLVIVIEMIHGFSSTKNKPKSPIELKCVPK